MARQHVLLLLVLHLLQVHAQPDDADAQYGDDAALGGAHYGDEEMDFTSDWEPPKCASWCHWEMRGNCAKDMCSDCEFCVSPPPAPMRPPRLDAVSEARFSPPPPRGTCNLGCNEKRCEETQCRSCLFCTQSDAMCATWCMHEHHCADERCDDCPHCADGSGGDGLCGSWCHGQHCGDSRCSACTFCTPAAPPPSPAVPPSNPPEEDAFQVESDTARSSPATMPRDSDAALLSQERTEAAPTPTQDSSPDAAEPQPQAMGSARGQCPNWCHAKHCELGEVRCSGCLICGARGSATTKPDAATPLPPSDKGSASPLPRQRPLICEPFCKQHHCRIDDRCSECSVCDGIAAVWPPPPPPRPPPHPPSPPPRSSPPPAPRTRASSPPSAARAPLALPADTVIQVGPPKMLTVRQTNCSAAVLSWQSTESENILEYELVVQPTSVGAASAEQDPAPFAISGVLSTQRTIDGLESNTDYKVWVRARGPVGWSAHSDEALLRTGPPSRLLPAPLPPVIDSTVEKPTSECATVHLRLPALRRGCARDTALVLEYREAGATEWFVYDTEASATSATDDSDGTGSSSSAGLGGTTESALQVTLSKEHNRNSAYFRLRARRGLIVSEPSVEIGPIATCESKPLRSTQTVLVAGGIALGLLLLIGCVVCRQATATADDGFSKATPPRREPGMTQLKTTTDEEDEPLSGCDELSVQYDLGHGEPFHGMLPLAGINNAAELLTELAEFGCELQDDVILSTGHMEAEFDDAKGKTKAIGPRTPLSEVVASGEVMVTMKEQQHKRGVRPTRVINGANSRDLDDDDDLELDAPIQGRRGGAVAVKVAPRPVGARAK